MINVWRFLAAIISFAATIVAIEHTIKSETNEIILAAIAFFVMSVWLFSTAMLDSVKVRRKKQRK